MSEAGSVAGYALEPWPPPNLERGVMATPRRIPTFLWRLMRMLRPRIHKTLAANARAGDLILLLTTTGRKSGLPRVTPLQYEEWNGRIYVASARGKDADWFKNLAADPRVRVQLHGRDYPAMAEPVMDPARIADFLELRLQRHPRMIRWIMSAEGLPRRFTRADLEVFARDKAVICLHLERDVEPSR